MKDEVRKRIVSALKQDRKKQKSVIKFRNRTLVRLNDEQFKFVETGATRLNTGKANFIRRLVIIAMEQAREKANVGKVQIETQESTHQ